MKDIHKIKKYLYWILILWIPCNMLLFILLSFFSLDLPISEHKIKFINNFLQSAEKTYNIDDNICYEDNLFTIMPYKNASTIKHYKYSCNFTSNIVANISFTLANYILYHDTIDKCCYGYYEVTYNPLDNTALCVYFERKYIIEPNININLSRTKLIKLLDLQLHK